MGSPWQKDVGITLESVNLATRKGRFSIDPKGLPTGPNGELLFYNDGHDGFDISFVLTDNTNQGYSFPPNSLKAEAVSSRLGSTTLCPPQGTSEVLSPKTSKDNVLRVHNPNQGKVCGEFSYCLWVTNDNGSTYIELDPGGVNHNGSTGGISTAQLIIGGIILVGAAVFVAYEFGLFDR